MYVDVSYADEKKQATYSTKFRARHLRIFKKKSSWYHAYGHLASFTFIMIITIMIILECLGDSRETNFLFQWWKCLQELEPVWEKSRILNQNSQNASRTKNINVLGFWAETVYLCLPSLPSAYSSCPAYPDDEDTVLPQSLLYPVSPTALTGLCCLHAGAWQRNDDPSPFPRLVNDEGSGSVLRTAGRHSQAWTLWCIQLLWEKKIHKQIQLYQEQKPKRLQSTSCLFTIESSFGLIGQIGPCCPNLWGLVNVNGMGS